MLFGLLLDAFPQGLFNLPAGGGDSFANAIGGVLRPLVLFLIALASVNYLLKLLRKYLNAPDSVSDFAQKTMRENDSIMSDLKRKERERSGL